MHVMIIESQLIIGNRIQKNYKNTSFDKLVDSFFHASRSSRKIFSIWLNMTNDMKYEKQQSLRLKWFLV